MGTSVIYDERRVPSFFFLEGNSSLTPSTGPWALNHRTQQRSSSRGYLQPWAQPSLWWSLKLAVHHFCIDPEKNLWGGLNNIHLFIHLLWKQSHSLSKRLDRIFPAHDNFLASMLIFPHLLSLLPLPISFPPFLCPLHAWLADTCSL